MFVYKRGKYLHGTHDLSALHSVASEMSSISSHIPWLRGDIFLQWGDGGQTISS